MVTTVRAFQFVTKKYCANCGSSMTGMGQRDEHFSEPPYFTECDGCRRAYKELWMPCHFVLRRVPRHHAGWDFE